MKACVEHHETAVLDVFDSVVPVLARFGDFMLIKVLVVAMHRLFGAVVPACIYPFLPCRIGPDPKDLSHDWLLQVVGISNMSPVACHGQLLFFSMLHCQVWLTDSPHLALVFDFLQR